VTRVELPKTLEEAHALILRLLAHIEEQERRIEELERRLNQSSQNSSRPPSSDPPRVNRPARKPRSGRKRGGQQGHKGHHREAQPPAKVDATEHYWPSLCSNPACGRLLSETGRVEVGKPQCHQVVEIPEIVAKVIEHVMHAQLCPDCQETTSCPWPTGVPAGNFGPRLTAAAGLLAGYRNSTRTVQELVRELFGASMSLGSVISCEQTVSRSVALAVEEARQFAEQQGVANADETSWRERGRKAWLWVMATSFVVVFLIQQHRNRAAAKQLLGSFGGTLTTDRLASYAVVHGKRRQVCWAHLARDFEGLSEYRGKVGRIGKELVRLTAKMFRWWHRVRDGTMTRERFERKMKPLQRRVEDLLTTGVTSAVPRASGMCWDIMHHHGDALWTFVEVEGVEPTNNRAERALRHAVLWRKSSFGTQSEAGSRFVERMLTVRATLRAQGRSVVNYIAQAVDCSLRGLPVPSLLPGSEPAAIGLAA
jgi:transposase